MLNGHYVLLLLKIVEERFYSQLPKDQLEKTTKSGDRLISNRIAWGKSYLKKGGLVHFPQRGYVQITEKGRLEKSENISLKKIQENVIDFYTAVNELHDYRSPNDKGGGSRIKTKQTAEVQPSWQPACVTIR